MDGVGVDGVGVDGVGVDGVGVDGVDDGVGTTMMGSSLQQVV